MLGMTLVTHQTGPKGRVVRRLYIEDGSDIARELYLSALVDRETSRIAFIASTEGGMDIEAVAKETPEKILTFQIDPAAGFSAHTGRRDRRGAEAHRRSGEAGGVADREALQGVRRQGHEPARDQSAGRHQGGAGDLPRRQDQLRRQRALSPSRHAGAARSGRGRSDRTRSGEIRSQLHQARRLDRLHGQRRGPCDGDHGHHQALRLGARELPRCRRRRIEREGDGGASRSSSPIRT